MCMQMIDYVRDTAAEVRYDPAEEPTCYVQAYKKNNKDQRSVTDH